MIFTRVILVMILMGLLTFGCGQESPQSQPSDSAAIEQPSHNIELAQVDETSRKQLDAMFAKDKDRSITFLSAVISNDGSNEEIVIIFTIDWIHAKVKGKLQWGLSPRESVVYQTYLAVFEHGRDLLSLFPKASHLRFTCCNQVPVEDKYGNRQNERLETYFECCQTRDMAANLNVDNAIRTMYMNGTSAAAKYMDCASNWQFSFSEIKL